MPKTFAHPAHGGAINTVLGDESFIRAYGREPDDRDEETLRVRTHLSYAERLLHQRATPALSETEQRARANTLDLLHRYWTAGVFPSNTNPAYRGTRRPCFIDASGAICAIGYLIERTAGCGLAEDINRQWHSAYVSQMVSPSLEAWVARSGLTVEECAIIQPGYWEGYDEDEEIERRKASIQRSFDENYKDAGVHELEVLIQGLEKEKDEAIHQKDWERASLMRDRAMELKRKKEEILTAEKVKVPQPESMPNPEAPPGDCKVESFSESARMVMSRARQEAKKVCSEYIGTEHILLGMLQEGSGIVAEVLKKANVGLDPERIRQEVEKLSPSITPTVTPRARLVLQNAGEAAARSGHVLIGPEHLLLGLLKDNEGMAAQVLANFNPEKVRTLVLEVLSADAGPRIATGRMRQQGQNYGGAG